MHKFVRNLLTEWRNLKLPFAGQTFVVAVSGGADSVSLALALDDLRKRKKLNLRFVLAHFNHDLRGAESARDAEFVVEFAGKFNFELAFKKGIVQKKGNLEQNARRARYEFLIETACHLHAHGILTAHTVNDQAETFLLNLIRGSGVDGLSGIKPVIDNFIVRISNSDGKFEIRNSESGIALIRPLLRRATRRDTEDYCRFHEVDYRIDAMNEELNFKRVRVRKVLIPALKEFNPKIIETLAKTAQLFQAERENASQTAAGKQQIDRSRLSLKELKILSKSELYDVLRGWLKARRGSLRQIDLRHIEAIERLIFSRKSGKAVELPGHEMVVKESGKLFWMKKNIENIG